MKFCFVISVDLPATYCWQRLLPYPDSDIVSLSYNDDYIIHQYSVIQVSEKDHFLNERQNDSS